MNDINFNPCDFNIERIELSLFKIINLIKNKSIDLNTLYHNRDDYWCDCYISLFIESILLGLPISSILISYTKDDNYDIIDGVQRLCAIKKFIIDDNIKLKQLLFLNKLNDKSYSELHRIYQRKIDGYLVSICWFRTILSHDIKSNIHKRINKLKFK